VQKTGHAGGYVGGFRGDPNAGIGLAGMDGYIPILGSGRDAIYWFQQGDVSRGILNTALAVTDVFLVRAIGKALIKGGAKLISKQAAKPSGRIFYVGEGAESLALDIASETGYKTIHNTWYGAIGGKVNPLLSQSNSRKMWKHLSTTFANGANYGDDIITVFGRHRSTGLHTLPLDSKAVWRTTEFRILNSKGIPYRPILTN